jgi:hypothetical protein
MINEARYLDGLESSPDSTLSEKRCSKGRNNTTSRPPEDSQPSSPEYLPASSVQRRNANLSPPSAAKIVFSFLLVIAVVVLSTPRGRITRIILSTPCMIPAIQRSSLCLSTEAERDPQPLWVDFPSLVKTQNTALTLFLDDFIGGPMLDLHMSKAHQLSAVLITDIIWNNLTSQSLLIDQLDFLTSNITATLGAQQTLTVAVEGSVGQ